jgi:hypothetical protein
MERTTSQRRTMGKTIPEFAVAYDLVESQVRRAADRGEIRTIVFAGLRRITAAEERRLCELFGLTSVSHVEGDEPGAGESISTITA